MQRPSALRVGVLTAVAVLAGCGGGAGTASPGPTDAAVDAAITTDAPGDRGGNTQPVGTDVPSVGTDVPAASTGYFPTAAPWTQDTTGAAIDDESAAVIDTLRQQGGWGTGSMRIDFSIDVLQADAAAPLRSFTPNSSFYAPDCDAVPVPLPPGGNLEAETGYACLGNGDCHLIVVHQPTRRLYEMWKADLRNGVFQGGCLAVWDLDRVYPPSGRGEQCTSADAGGFPIAPLLFTADEVAAGAIRHAIRLILPNSRIRRGAYVHPATHGTRSASGGPMSVPYGARLRLRPDFPLASLPGDGARVVARALQRYGMILADGGDIALTAQSDAHTHARWAGLLGARDLGSVQVTDFQMLAAGPRIPLTLDCARNP